MRRLITRHFEPAAPAPSGAGSALRPAWARAALLLVAGAWGCNAASEATPGSGLAANGAALGDAGGGRPARALSPPPSFDCKNSSPGDLFARRIEPLLAEDRPSSCGQCHLAGIDLSAFIRDDPCEAMACLEQKGLVDLKAPADSVILSWIDRATPDSPLITRHVIDQEFEGFLEWIQWSAQCGGEQCAQARCTEAGQVACEVTSEPPEPDGGAPPDGPADCDDRSLEAYFQQTIYALRGRCSPCHLDSYDNELIGEPPRWIISEGNCAQASLASLRRLEHFGLMDLRHPEDSPLLLKPLAVGEGGSIHGGGDKFHAKNDFGYLTFLSFIERYAECRRAP